MDPEPNPLPHVSGPPESRYVSHRSGSFYDQAKIIRENLDFYCFVTSLILYDFLSLKKDVHVASKGTVISILIVDPDVVTVHKYCTCTVLYLT
jgi:hypothetical protein